MDQPALSSSQRARLRGMGQRLEASLVFGREGASDSVLKELQKLLAAHELVKVRFSSTDRQERARLCEEVAGRLECECVGSVGRTALFFRQNPESPQNQADRE